MRNTTCRTITLLAAIACGCASADAEKRTSADVAVNQLPQPVVAAAGSAVQGLEITEAKRRAKRNEVVYKIEGIAADGREYELKVTESGKVLDVEADDDDGPKKKSATADANDSPFQRIGSIQHNTIRESSGVVASRQHPGLLWTHNDKNNAPELYAISSDGKLLGRYALNAVNDDWEDIDIDDQNRLYVGRIGNNDAANKPIEVLRVAEPDPANASGARRTLTVERTWRLRYPDKPFDCESLFVHDGHGYLISKHEDGRAAALYRFALEGGNEQTLTSMAELPIRQPVTGANLSPDGTKLAVLTYGTLYTFDVGGDLSRLGQTEPARTPTPSGKLEGVCFTPEGILLTAESRQIYRLDTAPTSTVSIDKAPAR